MAEGPCGSRGWLTCPHSALVLGCQNGRCVPWDCGSRAFPTPTTHLARAARTLVNQRRRGAARTFLRRERALYYIIPSPPPAPRASPRGFFPPPPHHPPAATLQRREHLSLIAEFPVLRVYGAGFWVAAYRTRLQKIIYLLISRRLKCKFTDTMWNYYCARGAKMPAWDEIPCWNSLFSIFYSLLHILVSKWLLGCRIFFLLFSWNPLAFLQICIKEW